jgi:hypothetical protein
MTRIKASFCADCVHFLGCPLGKPRPPCAKGHAPRFYMPPREDAGVSTRWGWMRACVDFTQKPTSE